MTPPARSSNYDIPDQANSQPRRLRIIHVGAGASGLLAAYKAERMLTNYELVCYDKNDSIGGTWYESKYPGCACDVPSHIYTYSFEPNPEWSGFYAGSAEIQEYFVQFARKYHLDKYVRLRTRVVSATWNEDDGKWVVELERNGRQFSDTCDILLNGSGVVNKMKWPNVEGLNSFKGDLMHSASWDPKSSWAGKRVAIIGTGSSSIQMLPHLANGSKSVHVFARNTTWITPELGSNVDKVDPDGIAPGESGKHFYIEKEKKKFRDDPELFLNYRKSLEANLTRGFPVFLRSSPLNDWARTTMRANMLARIGPGHEELKEKLIPSWSPGCRRLTPGENYLETLTQSHVHAVFEGVARFEPTGLVTTEGKKFSFDLIACATGFEISYIPHFKITGIGGITMRDAWAENPNIYLGLTGPKFPNYFVINGPTANWGQGCVLPSHEVQIEYALQCCKKIQEEGILALEVKQLPTTQWNEHLDHWHTSFSVWAENCRSWYKVNKEDGRVYIWPGSLLHLLKTIRVPRFEHYDIRYRSGNMWAFLGRGRTEIERMDENGLKVDLAPFIRNADEQWSSDPPQFKSQL